MEKIQKDLGERLQTSRTELSAIKGQIKGMNKKEAFFLCSLENNRIFFSFGRDGAGDQAAAISTAESGTGADPGAESSEAAGETNRSRQDPAGPDQRLRQTLCLLLNQCKSVKQ